MKIKNLIGILSRILFAATLVFAFTTGIILVFNIKSEWIPGQYFTIISYMQQHSLTTLTVLLGFIFFMSVLKDASREDASVVDAENLSSMFFYRISGDIEEKGSDVFAKLDVFGNILGTGYTYKTLVKVKKECFPYFMLGEKNEDRKIIDGAYLKINWTAK